MVFSQFFAQKMIAIFLKEGGAAVLFAEFGAVLTLSM
jgi:hypothetical protein